MTTISYSDLIKVRDTFKGLPSGKKPAKSSGQCPHKEYNYEQVLASPIYKVMIYGNEDVIQKYNTLMDKDKTNLTEEEFFQIVSMGLQVRSPLDMNTLLIPTLTVEGLYPKWEADKPSTINKITYTKAAPEQTHISVMQDDDVQMESEAMIIDTDKTEDKLSQATAICFVFAWTTRFAIKSPSSALPLQLKKMRESYLKFYNTSSHKLDGFNPPKSWFAAIQTAFGSFQQVKNTLAVYISMADSSLRSSTKLYNIGRYLFFQNLEFMGMHAYVSIVNIMNKVAISPALVLTWLRMQGMEDAIDEVGIIMGKYDNGMIDNGEEAEKLWKYARIIDEGYFNRMQTTYSPDLISVLANIEIELGLCNRTGYNSPLNIYAIKNNRSLLELGEAKAKVFLECVRSVATSDENASMIDKIYAKRTSGLVFDRNPSPQASTAPKPNLKRTSDQAFTSKTAPSPIVTTGGTLNVSPPLFSVRSTQERISAAQKDTNMETDTADPTTQ